MPVDTTMQGVVFVLGPLVLGTAVHCPLPEHHESSERGGQNRHRSQNPKKGIIR